MTLQEALSDIAGKEEQLARNERQIDALTDEVSRGQTAIRKLEHQLEQALKRLYGRRSERWDPRQRIFEELVIDAMEQESAGKEAAVVDAQEAEHVSRSSSRRNPSQQCPIQNRHGILATIPRETSCSMRKSCVTYDTWRIREQGIRNEPGED